MMAIWWLVEQQQIFTNFLIFYVLLGTPTVSIKYLSWSIVSAVENIISSLQQKLIGCGLKRWDLEFIIYCSSSIGAVLSSDVAGYPWQNMPRLSEQLRILARPATLRDLNNQWSIFSSLAQSPDTQLCWLRDSDHQNIQFRKIQRKRGTFSQGCLQNCFKSCVEDFPYNSSKSSPNICKWSIVSATQAGIQHVLQLMLNQYSHSLQNNQIRSRILTMMGRSHGKSWRWQDSSTCRG